MKTLTDQTKALAEKYPPNSRVKVIPEGAIGVVRGYRTGPYVDNKKMALILDILDLDGNLYGEVWCVYEEQVQSEST